MEVANGMSQGLVPETMANYESRTDNMSVYHESMPDLSQINIAKGTKGRKFNSYADELDMNAIERKSAQIRDSPEIQSLVTSIMASELQNFMVNKEKAVAFDQLPLARIKRIMKQESCDPRPRMVSSNAIVLCAYCIQLMVTLITQIGWETSVLPTNRNTFQLRDAVSTILSFSAFDFLLDTMDKFILEDASVKGDELSTQIHPRNLGK